MSDAAPRSALVGLLSRFVVVGGLSVALDYVVLFTLHSVLHVSLFWATAAGYGTSLGVNYTLNHFWVFEAEGEHGRRLARYLVLVGFNVASTFVLVLGLSHLGLNYLLAKLVAVVLNAIVNFVAYRHWVFS